MLDFWVPSRGAVALIPVWPHAGAPTGGTSGTFAGIIGIGDLLVDTTNAVTYQNTGTQASPTYTQLGTGASVAITGGTIDGVTAGATTPLVALTAALLHVDSGTKTATAAAGAATLNKSAGVITSEALTTVAGATYTLTITDSDVAAADQVMASVQYGTATTGTPAIATVATAAGSVVIVVQNIHASAALNGTIKVSFVVFKN